MPTRMKAARATVRGLGVVRWVQLLVVARESMVAVSWWSGGVVGVWRGGVCIVGYMFGSVGGLVEDEGGGGLPSLPPAVVDEAKHSRVDFPTRRSHDGNTKFWPPLRGHPSTILRDFHHHHFPGCYWQRDGRVEAVLAA